MFDQDLLGANEFMGMVVIPVDQMLTVHPISGQKIPNHAPMWCDIPTASRPALVRKVEWTPG
jgi:hypothetical protein